MSNHPASTLLIAGEPEMHLRSASELAVVGVGLEDFVNQLADDIQPEIVDIPGGISHDNYSFHLLLEIKIKALAI